MITPRRRRRGHSPSSASNWLSHTAYSSAVRRGSVAIRQRALISPPVDQREHDIGVAGIDREQHRRRPSEQEDVAGVNDTPLAVRQAQDQRAVARRARRTAPRSRCRRAGARSARVPTGCARSSQRARTGAQPLAAPARRASARMPRPASRANVVGRRPSTPCAARLVVGAIGQVGMMREVDAEADHHRIVGALEQDARQLGAVEQQVVGPFDRTGAVAASPAQIRRPPPASADRRDQRQRRGGRIARAQPDQRAGVEIAGRRRPTPRPAARAPRSAARRAATGPRLAPGARQREHIGIGRSRLRDGADRRSEQRPRRGHASTRPAAGSAR